MTAVGELGRGLERPWPPHRAHHDRHPLLDRAGEGEQAVVLVELTVEGDRALVEEGADDLDALDHPGQRFRGGPVDLVLTQQPEVAAAQHDLGAAAGEFVEGGGRLGDERRLPQHDAREARPEPDLAGVGRGRREEQPEVLVPGLVRGVAGVEPELVGELDGPQRLVEGVVGQHRVAELHQISSPETALLAGGSAAQNL